MRSAIIKMIFPLFTLLLSLVWIFLGAVQYGMWNPVKGPERGFFPVIIAVILFFASLFAMFRSIKSPTMPPFRKEESYVILSAISIYLSTYLIGLLPTLLVYSLFWLRGFERYPWKTTLLVTLVLTVVVYSVFVLWLGVLFPWGIFGTR